MVQAASGFKCRHGQIYETFKEAVICDMGSMFEDELQRREKLPGRDKLHVGADGNGGNMYWCLNKFPSQEISKAQLPPAILGAMLSQESSVIIHWVANNLEFLESLIAFYVQSMTDKEKADKEAAG